MGTLIELGPGASVSGGRATVVKLHHLDPDNCAPTTDRPPTSTWYEVAYASRNGSKRSVKSSLHTKRPSAAGWIRNEASTLWSFIISLKDITMVAWIGTSAVLGSTASR